MNRKLAKWTMVATLTTTMGLLAVGNNVKADTQGNPTTPTQQAISSSTISSTDLYAKTINAATTQYNQQFNVPNGYTLEAVRNIHDNTAATNFQNTTADQGMTMNNYTSDQQAAQENVNITNLTPGQTNQLNDFTLHLVNQVRGKFGESGYTQTNNTINIAKNMATQYQNKGESLLNKGWHDQNILQGATENISAYGLYNDHIANLSYRHFATMRGNELTNSKNLPLVVVTNMDDLQAMVYYGVMGMLFQDANDNFGHAQNILTNSHENELAVYPSITNAINSGTMTDSNGKVSHFNFAIQRVDMHFIWPTAAQLGKSNQQQPGHQAGWQNVRGTWYYYNNNGKSQSGWFKSGAGNWYYFNNDGSAQTGWHNINGNWYYFDNQNAWALTGWHIINSHWYYFDPVNAWADKGWFKSGAGNWYYFDWNNAWALTGWQDINGHWYYFDPTNAWALTGWQYMYNNWLYFDPTNAWQYKGWTKINGRWFYFNDKGDMLTGLQSINGQVYDLQTEHDGYYGAMKTGWQKVNGHWYLFASNGAAVTGWYHSGAGNWYYFNQNGQSVSGWQAINGRYYYFDPTNAWADTGWQKLGNNWYYFDFSNAWMLTGWQKLGHWFYFDDQGKMQTGHIKIDNRYSNFDSNGYWLGYAE